VLVTWLHNDPRDLGVSAEANGGHVFPAASATGLAQV
jgi:hypothetical protein